MLVPSSWAAAAAGALVVLGLVLRRLRRAPRGSDLAVETAIVLGLYALWQEGGSLALNHVHGAVAHAGTVWHLERVLHLPSEVDVQSLILPHPLLVEATNGFYDIVHVPALIGFLIWLYFRQREAYAHWRSIGAILTGTCLLIQMVPVAPPRLMPGLGFVDTAMRYKESVYAPGGIGDATQLAAMPSVHVAWAVFIAVAVISVSGSRWRWLILMHPAATLFAVVATANHWWLDEVVGASLLPLSAVVFIGATRVWTGTVVRRTAPVPAIQYRADHERAQPRPPAGDLPAYDLTAPSATSASAICTALSAAPLRRLSPETNMVSPQPEGSL